MFFLFIGLNAVCLPSEKRCTLKGKNLLPLGANSEFAPLGSKFFPVRVDSFQKGLGVQENKQEVAKVVSLVKQAEYLRSVSVDRKTWWGSSKYTHNIYVCLRARIRKILI